MYDKLDDVREDIARRLTKGANDRNSAMHSPVVATADADARIMILRQFDAANWTLRFHTDLRSPKVGVIGSGAQVGLLFYDKAAKIQIRIQGQGRIESDTPAADAAWAESTNFAKRCYLGEGPGASSDAPTSGLPQWAEGIQPTDEQVAPARENFAILLVDMQQSDWLYLAISGHRRALVTQAGGNWISP